MKKFFVSVATVFTLVSFSAPANAGFLIEPFVDFAISGDYDLSGSSSADLSTTMFGARLGMTTLGLMYGVEYATGSLTVEFSNGDADGSSTDMGVFVGYEFPVMVRVWLSYYVQSSFEFDGTNADTANGTGTKFGVGYTGLPYLSINFQMLNRSYDEAEDGAGGPDYDIDIDHTAYLLGISIPLP